MPEENPTESKTSRVTNFYNIFSDLKMAEAASEPGTSMKFEDLGLDEALLRGIYGYGFEVPSTIQQQAIPPMIS